MKQNGAGLATICILSTMVLVMVSGTASLYVGNSDILHNRYPREFNFTCRGDVEASMAAAEQASQEALTARGLAAQNLLRYRYAAFTALQEEDAFLLDIAGQLQSPTGIDGRIMELYLIPLEDYNRSTGQTLALGPDQILVHQNRRQYGRDTLTLAGRTFQVAGELPEFLDNGFSTADIVTSLFIVTPDYDTLEALRASVNASYGDGGSIAVQGYYCFDTGAEKTTQIELYSAIRESVRSRGQEDMTLESRANEEWGFFSLFGGLFFLGIFLGFLFLLATVLIIYYKQITEGYEDQTRFRTLQQVGMSKAEVRRTIHSQILTVLLPAPSGGRAPHGLRLPHDLQNASPLQPHRPDPANPHHRRHLPPLRRHLHRRLPPHLPLLLPHRHPRPLLGPCPSHVTRWERMGREPSLTSSPSKSPPHFPGTPAPWGGG